MAGINTFAAIDVGSGALSMKIFEVSDRRGIRRIDSVSNFIELGSDTYANGVISNALINQMCDILNKFKIKMQEYGVKEYRAYATSAVREADNTELLIDQIKIRTGIAIKVLSNSEQRFILYKALAANNEFFDSITSKNTAIVDIGAGSIQISLLDKQRLVATQNIRIGSIRVRDMLASLEYKTTRMHKLIEKYVGNEIDMFKNIYLREKEIKNVVAIGDEINNIIKIVPELGITNSINQDQIKYIYEKLLNEHVDDLALKYGIPYARTTLLLPSTIIYQRFLQEAKAELLYFSDIDLCDGIVVDYLDGRTKSPVKRDFNEDILATARNIAKRYKCNRMHVDNVTNVALSIFDNRAFSKIHGLGARERLQLEIACILHDCGKFINMRDGSNNSYNIIMSTEIMGLSHKEREEIANIALYNTFYLPGYEKVRDMMEPDSYMKVSKLASILRVANIMDRSQTKKINSLNIKMTGNTLVITVNTSEDITLEKGLFEARADYFEKVFGIRPILKQRRSVQ